MQRLPIIRGQLHADFNRRLCGLETRLYNEDLSLEIYEGWRTPERQAALYARGRKIGEPGKTVTRAKAWHSHHQYGLAADFVHRQIDKTRMNAQVVRKGSGRDLPSFWVWWPASDPRWEAFHRFAKEAGLEVLGFEKPHVQFPWPIEELLIGRYPTGGGSSWEAVLSVQSRGWGYQPRTDAYGIEQCGAPPPHEERPVLEDVT